MQTMKDILNRMLNHEELTREETRDILVGITRSEYPNEQITALLTALQMRGITVSQCWSSIPHALHPKRQGWGVGRECPYTK